MLSLDELTVGYAGFRAGPVSARLETGIVHLAGRNGTGKTTLLRTVCGERAPLAGQVRMDGLDPLRDPKARGRVGMLPSADELPGFLTVGEAWRITAGLRRCPAWDGAAMAALLGVPEGLRISSGSAGQRRKAELLCALVGDPPMLLLDEPFAHLDAATAEVLEEKLRSWSPSHLILLAQHEPPPLAESALIFTERPPERRGEGQWRTVEIKEDRC